VNGPGEFLTELVRQQVAPLLRQQAEVLTQLAVAVNRQTQALEALAATTARMVEAMQTNVMVIESPEPDEDETPSHYLDGTPIRKS
jgi:hypothetical protein